MNSKGIKQTFNKGIDGLNETAQFNLEKIFNNGIDGLNETAQFNLDIIDRCRERTLDMIDRNEKFLQDILSCEIETNKKWWMFNFLVTVSILYFNMGRSLVCRNRYMRI